MKIAWQIMKIVSHAIFTYRIDNKKDIIETIGLALALRF